MDWIEKMKQAMELVHLACKENSESSTNCKECPFGTYCDLIFDEFFVSPNEERWIKKGGESIE